MTPAFLSIRVAMSGGWQTESPLEGHYTQNWGYMPTPTGEPEKRAKWSPSPSLANHRLENEEEGSNDS